MAQAVMQLICMQEVVGLNAGTLAALTNIFLVFFRFFHPVA
jgi:hypothetical protein